MTAIRRILLAAVVAVLVAIETGSWILLRTLSETELDDRLRRLRGP